MKYDKKQILIFEKRRPGALMILGITVLDIALGWLFYRSFIACAILLLPAAGYMMLLLKELRKADRKTLNLQFREGLNAISTNVGAGDSLINACIKAYDQLGIIYREDALIMRFFRAVLKLTEMNIPIETALYRISFAADDKDMISFARVVKTAGRSGGDMRNIITSCAASISARIAAEAELNTMISAKRSEFRIMCIAPLFIILYLSIFSPGVIAPLYASVSGRITATVCLALYAGAVIAGRRITDISL
ncbi:MAG: hypothetical protein IJL97_05225 [Lachnospiraceae bacterium]|nr:hypothetical protein [Lachnospiraceae bacterium]